MKTTIKVGIIGLGIGKSHIEAYRTHPGCEVTALADTDRIKLQLIGENYGITTLFDSGEALIDSGLCDVISICTPNCYHKDLSIRALNSGAHVLCEKPMALNSEESELMCTAAQESGKRLMINFSYRFTRAAQALKARIDAGALGQPYYARASWLRRRGMPGFGGWFGTKAMAGGGPLIDLGVHKLDLALWFMGYPEPTQVLARTYAYIASEIAASQGKQFDVEDLAAAFITCSNGASISLEAAWAANIKENESIETRVLGTRGGLVHKNKGESYVFDAEFFHDFEGHCWDERFHEGSPWTSTVQPSAMYHFIDAILTDKPHDADHRQGHVIMKILDAVYESARTGSPATCSS